MNTLCSLVWLVLSRMEEYEWKMFSTQLFSVVSLVPLQAFRLLLSKEPDQISKPGNEILLSPGAQRYSPQFLAVEYF